MAGNAGDEPIAAEYDPVKGEEYAFPENATFEDYLMFPYR